METFTEYLAKMKDPSHRLRVEEVFRWIEEAYPDLQPRIGWNQPMYTHHGTFIIGFSESAKHLAVTPEPAGIEHFSADIVQAGYEHSRMLFRIPWGRAVDHGLLARMIDFNLKDKADCTTFWRK